MAEDATQQEAVTKSAKSISEWASHKRHEITLPSGAMVEIEVPNLPKLIKGGQIPNDLIDAALATAAVAQNDKPTREQIEQQADFNDYLVTLTVKNPELAPEDVDNVPAEDVDMIVEIAQRQRDVDALYRHIGGLHKSAEWQSFRGLGGESADLAGT